MTNLFAPSVTFSQISEENSKSSPRCIMTQLLVNVCLGSRVSVCVFGLGLIFEIRDLFELIILSIVIISALKVSVS